MGRSKEIDLHDAQLKALNIDYKKREVVIQIDYYCDPIKDKRRVGATLTFKKVASYSSVADFNQLSSNFAAGNISNWWREVDGKTYLYLAGGCMIIEAKSVKFEKH